MRERPQRKEIHNGELQGQDCEHPAQRCLSLTIRTPVKSISSTSRGQKPSAGWSLLPLRLGYVDPPHRKWLIGSTFRLLRQFVQPPLLAVRFDVLACLVVHSRRTISSVTRSKCGNHETASGVN